MQRSDEQLVSFSHTRRQVGWHLPGGPKGERGGDVRAFGGPAQEMYSPRAYFRNGGKRLEEKFLSSRTENIGQWGCGKYHRTGEKSVWLRMHAIR